MESGSNGSYAIITGAAGGLGTSFALSCARRGYNLLLLDVPNPGLEKLGNFLGRNFPVSVKHLGIDLSERSAPHQVLEMIRKEEMRVGMLVNNAGLPQNELFEFSDGDYLRKLLEVNGIVCVSLTHALLPELKKNSPAHIINVSSLGGYFPLPRKSVYAAVKGFVRLFSQALSMELGDNGVKVSILCPAGMTTNSANYMLHRQLGWFPSKMLLHPRFVAEEAVRKALKGQEIIIPGRTHRVVRFIGSLIPTFVVRKLARASMKQLAGKAKE
jgi:hypothetical protein